jgi:hypothetical protein
MLRVSRAAVVVSVCVTLSEVPVSASQHASMPPGITHEEHLAQQRREAEVKQRGASAMGFDQDATTHHFRLYADGGAIEVDVNDASDHVNRERVRIHLKAIASEFAGGEFGRPFETHAEVPPGVPVVKARRSAITYRFEETRNGARVRITTADAEARQAVHAFLRYQIREHGTGDVIDVTRPRLR